MLKYTARDRLKILGGGASLLLTSCGPTRSNERVLPTRATPPPVPTPPAANAPSQGQLRERFSNDFKVGAVLHRRQIDQSDVNARLASSQFNSLTPSFELKADTVSPAEGVFNFDAADRIVDWGIANGMEIRGHTLLWHISTPDYFFEGSRGQIRTRLETYIRTVVEHFRGRIQFWDVVNEVVSADIFRGDSGIGPDRRSRWFDAVGSADYIDWAFQAAREADPNALLFLNEYSTEHPMKQGWLLEILRRLQDRDVPIDGVGHQFHLSLGSNSAQLMRAIDVIDNQFMGFVNHVTEFDVDFYDDPGSCWDSQTNCDPDIGPNPPASMLAAQARLAKAVFEGLSQRPSVTSVTSWGVTDNESWLNTSPINRFNHPLLFDRAGNPKPAFWALVDPNYIIPT